MRRTPYLLAATLLAASFCADHAMAATPALRPEVVQLAEKLVNRLSESFSRTAVSIVIFPRRQTIGDIAPVMTEQPSGAQPVSPHPLSPFEFRLPPPAV
jgi:hypothetical protein